MPIKAARDLARTTTRAYRLHMRALTNLDPLSAWRSHPDVAKALRKIDDPRLREQEMSRLRAGVDAGHRGYPKLIERRSGDWRIKAKPPLLLPLSRQTDDTHEQAARTAFISYRDSLPEDQRILLERYRLTDVALKVVGVGSIGTFCVIGLFATRDGATLLLQLKEARESALAPYVGPSTYRTQGQRVVVGQRVMQTLPDIFLGWTGDEKDDQHCYVRRLKDSRLALIGAELADGALPTHAALCGATLARAHARSGDAARIAGYLGSGDTFDAAIAEFSLAYSDQTERDWRLFLDAIKYGQIAAHEG
jgi:uncharacterized protein (DUF2252 family)